MGAKIGPKSEKCRKKGVRKSMQKKGPKKMVQKRLGYQPWVSQGSILEPAGGLRGNGNTGFVSTVI